VLRPDDWAFLEEQRVGRLATAGADGRPHVVPVCFARWGDRLYVPVDAKPKRADPRALRRLRNVRERPTAALLVDRYDEDWSRLRWLLLYVRVRILEAPTGDPAAGAAGDPAGEAGATPDAQERAAALANLEARYPQYAAMGLAALGLPVLRLEPGAVRRWSA
jgi:PPOX class probable F420-dependent enzyme